MGLNKTQSSPAGWTVSRGEPGGPVLPCSGLPAWVFRSVLAPPASAQWSCWDWGGLHVQEGGFVAR